VTTIGELSLWVALVMAAWSAVLPPLGIALHRGDLIASGARAALVAPLFLALAVAGLASALLRGDFSLGYVAAFASANLPPPDRVAALWGAPAGALLVWALALSICTAAVAARERAPHRSVALALLGILLTAALAAAALSLRPFARLDWVPADGTPGAPAFPTRAAALAPPFLLAGLAAATVPFALAAPALARRTADPTHENGARGWALAAWIALTAGLALAAREWHAAQAGAPGSAALAAWLGTTVLLHARRTSGGRRAWPAWAPWVAAATFAAALAPLASLPHMGAPGTEGWTYVTLRRLAIPLGAITLALLGAGGDGLRWRGADARTWARRLAWPLAAAMLALGALVALGARSVPELLGCALGAFAAAGSARRLAGAARARDRGGAAGALAHAGASMLALAVAGTAMGAEYEGTLRTGQSLAARDGWGREWRFVSDGLSSSRRENFVATVVSLTAVRDGRRQALMTSELRQYVDVRERPVAIPVAAPSVFATPWQDIRLTLVDAAGEDEARVRVAFAPLARWLWYGAATMLAGGLLGLWPARRRDGGGTTAG